jgi:hypothetical protein
MDSPRFIGSNALFISLSGITCVIIGSIRIGEFVGVIDARRLDLDQLFVLARSLEPNSRYFQRLSAATATAARTSTASLV